MAGFFDTVFPNVRDRAEKREFERAQRAMLLGQQGARATLLGGYDPETEITWESGRAAPRDSAAMLDVGDITGGVRQGSLQVPTQQGADYSAERRLLANQAFPDAAAARASAQFFPAAPSLQKLGPGDVLGSAGIDPVTGKPFFNELTQASFAPDKPLGPQSGQAKLKADRDAGMIDEATYRAALAKENHIPQTGPTFNPADTEKGLRSEFDNKTKDFATVRDAYGKITKVADNPSPAGDISLIFSFMKMLDPGSTVREGEYATAQQAGSIPNTVWARYNKAVAGETLTPPQRADFVGQASNLYESQLGQYQGEVTRYTDLANRNKVNPENVVSDRTGGLKPRAKKSPPPLPEGWVDMGNGRARAPNGKIMKWVPN